MAKPPSKAAERRARRQAQVAAEEQAALDHWFTVSGSTMADLSAAIAQWHPGNRPTDFQSIHPKVVAPVKEHPQIDPDSKIRIVRAMQSVAMRRVKRMTAEEKRKPRDARQFRLL